MYPGAWAKTSPVLATPDAKSEVKGLEQLGAGGGDLELGPCLEAR